MRIAICGFAPPSYKLAPYNDPEWEIWGLNHLYTEIPRWDRWFEIHDQFEIDHWEWMKAQPADKPIYMNKPLAEIPGCVVYPLQKVLDRFGNYFTNTVSYMIALAILEIEAKGDSENIIGLYGVDMATSSEYGFQRPSCEYMIGVARGLGIKVIIPAECDLMKASHLYGFEEEPEVFRRLTVRVNEHRQREQNAKTQIEKLTAECIFNRGAAEFGDYVLQNWGGK